MDHHEGQQDVASVLRTTAENPRTGWRPVLNHRIVQPIA